MPRMSVLLVIVIALLTACGRGGTPLDPGNGGGPGGSNLDYDLITHEGSIYTADQVSGSLISTEDAVNARTTSALPSGYAAIQGMHFVPHVPRGAGFSGLLTVRITAGSPPAGEFDGVLLHLFYIDPDTLEASLMDAARGNSANRVSFELDGLGYFVIAENLSIPRPDDAFWISAFADLALATEGTAINFNVVAHGGVAPVSFEWDMDDGTQLSGAQVTHVFANAGEFNVTVTATDADGNVAPTISTPITISNVPVPLDGVTVEVSQDGANHLQFNYFATISGGEAPYTLAWDFDGDTLADSSANGLVEHTFAAAGLYGGSLTVTDANEQSVSADFTSDARRLVLDADRFSGDAPLTVNFTLTADGFNPGDTITVDFGDGESLTDPAANFAHNYTNGGSFSVSVSGSGTAHGQAVVLTGNELVVVVTEPVITSVLQLTQPILPTAGAELDLYGYDLGGAQGNRKVMLNTVELNVVDWSPEKLRVQLPAVPPATRALLRVTGSSVDSNGIYVTFNTASVPADIQNVIPFSGHASQHALIIGHGFGATPVAVTLDGTACTVRQWSENAALVDLPASAAEGGSQLLSMALPNGVVNFLVSIVAGALDEPVVATVTPAVLEAGTGQVQLDGDNFLGGYGGIVFAQGLVLETQSWTNSQITLADPPTTIESWAVVVRQDLISNDFELAILRRPEIANLVPAVAAVGDTVDIQGLFFTPTQADGFAVNLGALPCTVVSWSDTLIRIQVPVGAADGDIVVQTRLDSNGVPLDIVPRAPGQPNGGQI